MTDFDLALSDVCQAYVALEPPTRMRVSEGAATNLVIKRPGGASGNWNPRETPYMVEPTDMLASRRHSAVCFVGPAQTGKTVALGEGWFAHAVVNDPGDMLIVQMTQDKAREYSKGRIDRAIRNSPALRAMKTPTSRDDNLHDKSFRNGMMLKLAWPTASNLSSTSYRYVFGTDYDRWPDNIDGEGDGFTLMGKRTTTFLSRGMTAVESSPGRPITDPAWTPATPHEPPPVGTDETGSGILGIYGRSDRRRLYWKCPRCGEWFQATPGLGLFNLPDDDQLIEDVRDIDIDVFARQYARIACPANGCVLPPETREAMNLAILKGKGGWLADGLKADSRDRVSGTARTSSIAGYWLGGVAATYVSWEMLIRKHLQALYDYTMTGNELPLQTTVNTDQGAPYMSRVLAEAARAAQMGRPVDDDPLERYIVPDEGRFLVAMVDVQGGKNARFVVQVHAVGEHKEQWLVDRYAITTSKREGMDGEMAPLDPAAYAEDWDLLTEKIVDATYRTNDPDREMKVRLTVVDTGGEDGVTDKAYAWYRRVRKAGKSQRVRLIKGSSTRADWHIRETEVGGKQGNGDVPLFLLNPNLFKDMVSAGLSRRKPGPGYYHFPQPRHPQLNPDGWLLPAFFDELHAEVRNDSGVWEQVKKRNESFDLCYMGLAGCMMLGCDKPNFWANPPAWARPHDSNSEIVTPETRRAERERARQQAGTVSAPAAERRARRSSYMG